VEDGVMGGGRVAIREMVGAKASVDGARRRVRRAEENFIFEKSI
jgi:hypothetical protein